jgi:two-component system, cell cycle sensor histidine kinase and response regulator CckA
MVARAERAGWRARGGIFERATPSWISFLETGSLASASAAGILALLSLGNTASTGFCKAVTITTFGFVALAGATALIHRRANAALSWRLELMTRLLDTAPEARLMVTPDGRVGYANAAFDRLFPDHRETVLDSIRQTVCTDPQSRAQFRALCCRAAAGVRATVALCLSTRPTGTAARFEFAIHPLPDHPGYSLWSIRDVTASDGAAAAVIEERNKLLDLLDHVPIGLYSVDGQGGFRFVNRTLAEWLDTTPSEIMSGAVRLHDLLAFPPAAETPAFAPFAFEGAGPCQGEMLLRTRQGITVPAWIRQSVAEKDGELHTRSVVCDLMPEREWKTALRSSERFRRCFANAPVGIALVDRFGRFEEANRALGGLFGTTSDNLKGHELIDLLSEDDRDRIAAKLAAAASGQMDPEPAEIRPKRPGDRTMVLFFGRLADAAAGAALSPAASRETEPEDGLTLHFIDVTEQKNLEAQFAQSQKMQAIGQLAGGVAHDFNNLLTAMIGFCDLLLLRSPPSDPAFADIMQIKQNANRAANLVRQLLAFSRQQTLQPRILNVTDILYELRHLIERLIGENIKLDVVHGRDLGFVKVDQGQFEQVIINMAVNARDAMPDGGILTIRTANVCRDREMRRGHEVMPAGEYVLIELADTGVGIPKENLDRIFDPFFSTKELGAGTGLGLSTVYGIIKQTGGFVFAASRPGEGAAFEIYLQRCDPAEPAASARLDAGEPVAAKDLTGQGTIMLVEDDDPVRIFGARALRNKGYRVIEAKSGEAALARIRNAAEKIDLLITDVVMPHMDGPGLARAVRELHPEMKVIFISGYTEDAFRQRLDRDGDIDFMPKPFSLRQLAAKVRDVLVSKPG